MRSALLLLAALPATSLAQTQIVKPPIALYWMSVETAAGMTMPGMGSMGSMMAGGVAGAQTQGGRRMHLQLGSRHGPQGEPRAAHEIPPGLHMGPQLPLVTPRREPAPAGEPREMPEGMDRPKGRMLIYWGCGTEVRAGQPIVIDFAKVAEGQTPPGMLSRGVRGPSGPAFGRSRTYGDWPNPEDAKVVPEGGSLKGDHLIKGNYSPEIRFALEKDFLDKVQLAENGGRLDWKAVPGSTGYFAMLWGGDGNDVVLWSSSEVQEMGGGLMDYVPPSEVARLIKEKVVMTPQTTGCAVPGEVVKKAGGSALLQFIAYGEEANFVHPPRPKDPKVAWEPQWAAKVRFKSTASLLLGEGAQRPSRAAREESRQQTTQEAPKPSTEPDPVKEGIKALRGIFGR
jgi:hypothetical protein